ncbi:probable tubulin polyglutamylase TTLL2 [Eleginops maclovinus]|uniref:probable tubulin polyglutamylase TTLL2 n=1 Tax=Eleginops maclovinus TaxID=56733 RepID=UPI003080831A
MEASLVFRLHERGPEVVREVLLERGWEEYDEERREEEDWNLYWRGSAFRNSEYLNLLPWQRLNHHPKTVGITRKDCLARNLRRMRATFGSSLYDFSPTAFILPNDYTRFLSEYNRLSRGPSLYWICKPVDLSRGRGIFVFEDIRELVYDCSVIVQQYVSNPLLISGYKFDLRIYVCVKSFRPLTVYIHQEGLVRFATEKYNLSSLHNLYAHLTNTSINKFGPFYRTEKERVGRGCKWTMSKFRHFLQSQDVDELLLWQRINNIVTLTLLTIAPAAPSYANCVELLGFDILIDERFKPWLLEVNNSPALTLDCQVDITVKKRLIGDLIDLMNYTLTDSMREQGHLFQYLCLKKANIRSKGNHLQTLPKIKTHRHRDRIHQRQHAFAVDYQRHLPPVHLNKTYATKVVSGNKSNTKDRTLNLILGPQSRTDVSAVNRRTWLTDDRSLCVSEFTNRDGTETEAEADVVSSTIREIPHGGLGFRREKLPNMYSGIRREGTERPAALNRQHVPLRVGDFIRTFPFNTATLTASQHSLDVRRVIQELHRLTAQLASREKMKRREEEEQREGEEDFESLLWGPKDPPLLRQCVRPF